MSSGKINRTEAVQICKSSDIDTLIISQTRKQCHGVPEPEGSIPFFDRITKMKNWVAETLGRLSQG